MYTTIRLENIDEKITKSKKIKMTSTFFQS